MVLCLIVGCGNKTGKRRAGKERTRFFRVPRVVTNQGEFIEELTSERRRRWISAISRDDLTEGKRENDRVCSKHFVSGEPAKEWDRFNVDWVPTQNLGHHKLRGDPEKVAERANRAAQRRKRKQEVLEKEISEKRKRVSEPDKPVEEIFQGVAEAPVAADCPSDTSIYSESTSADQEKFGTIATAEPQTSCTKFQDVETQTFAGKTTEAATQTSELEYLFKECKIQPFTETYFDSEDKVRFYTGLPSLDVVITVLGFVEPHIKRKSKTLTPFQELIMVFMKLRLNVPQQDLAYRFDISQSTVSRIFFSWMTVLDGRLSPLIVWPEREELWRTMPKCFEYSFGKRTTIIIDCFEIYIERPSNLLARAQTFSSYKHHNTVKVLIGITPQGSICFVSRAWGGRTSDKHLTENCGLLKNLNPGDLVMADRGFTIEESPIPFQAKLAIPAFTRGKSHLDPVDIERTRGIANVRIHVERVIGLLRQRYTILQSILSIDYLICSDKSESKCPMVEKLIRVCSALTNLTPPIVPFD